MQRLPVLIRGPGIVTEYVAKNRQVDQWVASQFSRQVKTILIQLSSAWRKCCNQTNLHQARSQVLENTDLQIWAKLLLVPAREVEESLLLNPRRETNRIPQLQRVAVVLELAVEWHRIRNGKSALHRVVGVKAHVARIGRGGLNGPVAGGREFDAPGRAKRLSYRKLAAFDSPRPQVFSD